MNRQRAWLFLVAWGAMAVLSCGRCEARGGERSAAEPGKPGLEAMAIDPSAEPEFLRLDPRLIELAGEVDTGNRYLSAVMISAIAGEQEKTWCSGVALSRHLVLTSGHCVCPRRLAGEAESGGRSLIDTLACFETAKVGALAYLQTVEQGIQSAGSRTTLRHGTVRPHPALKIVLDEQGRVLSTRADFALIRLSKPLEFSGMPLADHEVRVGDVVTIVGYGYDEVERVSGSERRFTRNKVQRLATAEDERVLIEQPGGHRYRQDSGGPCLRQTTTGPELVGISSRWLGDGAAFTSIQGYQGWLREELRHAEAADPSPK
ncbi:trypsin-like peptidase domain-containing protein [Hyalangium gracile]|uniref:trypsin-like peptidase domain-containing protein n=1 Tax=Hyalangium gracile TaxID=394092 RepID=UPI001CCE3E48|nr:trypsin-like peptidase domain-containing protein [Hyalangium gracile]